MAKVMTFNRCISCSDILHIQNRVTLKTCRSIRQCLMRSSEPTLQQFPLTFSFVRTMCTKNKVENDPDETRQFTMKLNRFDETGRGSKLNPDDLNETPIRSRLNQDNLDEVDLNEVESSSTINPDTCNLNEVDVNEVARNSAINPDDIDEADLNEVASSSTIYPDNIDEADLKEVASSSTINTDNLDASRMNEDDYSEVVRRSGMKVIGMPDKQLDEDSDSEWEYQPEAETLDPIIGDVTSYYDFLELPRDANQQQIKMAYIRLAKMYHPDTYSLSKINDKQLFTKITMAYQLLSDPEEKEKYDEELRTGIPADGTDDHVTAFYKKYDLETFKLRRINHMADNPSMDREYVLHKQEMDRK